MSGNKNYFVARAIEYPKTISAKKKKKKKRRKKDAKTLFLTLHPLSPVMIATFSVQCCFTSTETIRTIRDGFATATVVAFVPVQFPLLYTA